MDRFEAAYGSLREAMPVIAQVLVGAVEDQFQAEESWGVGPWPPLAESTLAKRRAHGEGAKMLQDTGVLVGSITPEWADDWAMAFTNVPYAVYHTSDAPRHVIPYRNPFDVDRREVTDEASEMFLQMLVKAVA